MKNNYLVVVLNDRYDNDFLILRTETPEEAHKVASKLPKVLQVISVWSEVIIEGKQ
jgi:hypothetical protein